MTANKLTVCITSPPFSFEASKASPSNCTKTVPDKGSLVNFILFNPMVRSRYYTTGHYLLCKTLSPQMTSQDPLAPLHLPNLQQ